MMNRLQTSGWVAAGAALVLLAATALAVFFGGIQFEAGGVKMTLSASTETGVKLLFAAADR